MTKPSRRVIRSAVLLSAAASAAALATSPPATYRGQTTQNTYQPLPAADGVKPAALRVSAVSAVSDELRQANGIADYYTKSIVVRGVPIIGSAKVSDYAMLEAAYVLDHMLAGSPDRVRSALTAARTRLAVMSTVEYSADLPEFKLWHTGDVGSAAFWDQRARGLGGLPDASCAEENILSLPSDPYRGENIQIHEFSHTLASAMKVATPAWYGRLRKAYESAMAAGLFKDTYSASNEQEYWAEGVQAWFDCAVEKLVPGVHGGIWHRAQIKAYDPELAAILAETFGDGPWRYTRSDGVTTIVDGRESRRPADEVAHLAGLDRAALPPFNFKDSPRVREAAATQAAATQKSN